MTSVLHERFVVKQYGLERTGTNAARALLQGNMSGVRVLMHVLGDKHSPPVDLADALTAVRGHPQPALAFVTLASRLAPARTTAIDDDERQQAHLAAVADDVFHAATTGQIRVLVSIRDPYDWARAVLHWTRDLPADDPRAIDLLVPRVRAMSDRFNASYTAWFRLLERSPHGAAVVRFEDLAGPLDPLLDRLARELDVPLADAPLTDIPLTDVPRPDSPLTPAAAVTAVPARPAGARRQPSALQPTFGATRWDDAPILVDTPSTARHGHSVAARKPLPGALAAVVTQHVDWSLIERLGYRPGALAPADSDRLNGRALPR